MAASNDAKEPKDSKVGIVRIMVDLDGVCADLDKELVRVMKEEKLDGWQYIMNRTKFEYGDEPTDGMSDAQITVMKNLDKVAKSIMKRPGFYLSLPLMDGCVEALKAMEAYGRRMAGRSPFVRAHSVNTSTAFQRNINGSKCISVASGLNEKSVS